MESLILIPIIIFIITFITFIFSNIGVEKINEIQITPPENMNPLELAYIYKERVNSSDVVSLIPYLIDKKYIKIEFPANYDFSQVCNFTLIRNKDYDGNNALENYIFNRLFEKNNTITYNELCNNPEYKRLFEFCANLVNSDMNHKNFFSNKFKILNIFILLGLFVFDSLSNIYIYLVQLSSETSHIANVSSPLFIGLLFIYLIQIFFIRILSTMTKGTEVWSRKKDEPYRLHKKNLKLEIIMLFIIFLFSIAFIAYENLTIKIAFMYFFGIFIFVLADIIHIHINKRTRYFENLHQKVLQFRDFLRITPRESIEAEFNKNKDCYFDIFSYCFTLDMSSKCTSEFDKFFNNLWTILGESTDTNKNMSEAEENETISKFFKGLEFERKEFIDMLTNNNFTFLGFPLHTHDIKYKYDLNNINSKTKLRKYVFEILKNFILNP